VFAVVTAVDWDECCSRKCTRECNGFLARASSPSLCDVMRRIFDRYDSIISMISLSSSRFVCDDLGDDEATTRKSEEEEEKDDDDGLEDRPPLPRERHVVVRDAGTIQEGRKAWTFHKNPATKRVPMELRGRFRMFWATRTQVQQEVCQLPVSSPGG